MQAVVSLIVVGLVLVLVVFPLWAIMRISALGRAKDELEQQLQQLAGEIRELRAKLLTLSGRPAESPPAAVAAPASVAEIRPVVTATTDRPTPVVEAKTAPVTPPVVPVVPDLAHVAPLRAAIAPVQSAVVPPSAGQTAEPDVPLPACTVVAPPVAAIAAAESLPPPLPAAASRPAAQPPPVSLAQPPAPPPPVPPALPTPPPEPDPEPTPGINWEQFMGAKLFAWLGGLAGLLAVGFFVKYSFEHDLIPPEVRVAIGFLFALGLVIGGLKIDRARYAVTSQTLIATGIVSLYTVTFACRSVYHFAFFGPVPTFLLMALITGTAFLLAVRLEAQVVAILGILGGFLTPILVSTGQDNPLGLFGYLALLDVGLVAVALHRRWHYLVPLGAAGTVAMQVAWAGKFFTDESAVTAVVVCLAFAGLFLGTTIYARRRGQSTPVLTWSTVAMAGMCYLFGLFFLGYPAVGARVGLVFSFLLLANLCLLALAWCEGLAVLVGVAAAGTALLLASWAAEIFTPALAPTAMAVGVGFDLFFFVTYLVARRLGRSSREIFWSAVALPLVLFGFALFFLGYPEVASRVVTYHLFVLAAVLTLFVLAWCESKPVLVATAAIAVGLVQIGWFARLFRADLALTVMVVSLAYAGLFLAVNFFARRAGRSDGTIRWSAVGLPFLALGFALVLLGYPAVAARPGLLLAYVTLADLCLLALAWYEESLPRLHLAAGTVVFLQLAVWTGSALTAALLPWALAFYLLHAVLHTAFPLMLERRRPEAAPGWWSQLFPPLTLVLMLVPLFKLEAVSLVFWPCVLIVDLLAIGLALITASLAAVGIVLLLTLLATAVWIFHLPVAVGASASLLLVIGGFAVLFFAAGIFLARKLGDRVAGVAAGSPYAAVLGDARAQIPALSALLPFLLLIMMTARLTLANPSPVFGLALLLVVLVLGLAVLLSPPSDGPAGAAASGPAGIDWLPACALAGVAGLEYSWRARHFATESAGVPLAWYLAFYAIFAAYPFVFRRRFRAGTGPWAVAAFAGVAQFPLVHLLVTSAWPNDFPGVLPLLFAVAPLVSLVAILRSPPADDRARLNQLAVFGGVALLFLTLVFPIQFDRQWLTLGWALEGAALLWLFHRVPHPGLRVVGSFLLVTAFARLALNPAVFSYHARSATALLNWYLYSYGIVTACLFAGAHLLAPPRARVLGINAPVVLNTLGTILAFLLLNIEIADFFSAPGQPVLTFRFSGHFGRDMTYTIAWALFALGLLLMCIWKQTRAGRYAALALLSTALLKLFFHDLARLDALYRVGALFAVAIIATLASFAYQRFLPTNEKRVPPQS